LIICTRLLSALTVGTSAPPYLPTLLPPSIHPATLSTELFVVITLAKYNLERLKFARAVKGNTCITVGRDWEFLGCDITIYGTSFRSLTIVTNWLGPVCIVIKCVTTQHCQRPNLWPKTTEVE
jgi:hypothetical protein